MAKNPLSNMLAQAVKPGSVPAPGGKSVPPKFVQKSTTPPMPPAKGPPSPPPPGGKKANPFAKK